MGAKQTESLSLSRCSASSAVRRRHRTCICLVLPPPRRYSGLCSPSFLCNHPCKATLQPPGAADDSHRFLSVVFSLSFFVMDTDSPCCGLYISCSAAVPPAAPQPGNEGPNDSKGEE